MLQELSNVKKELQGLSGEDKVIVWTLISMFLPFFVTVPAVIFAFFYMIKEGRLQTVMKKTPFGYTIAFFLVLTLVVSLCYRNWWGVGLGILLGMVIMVLMYYRTLVNHAMFDLIVRIAVFLMCLCAVYALFEYAYRIIVMLDWDIMALPIPSKRQYRIRVGFFNANYYAMMIEFTILLCLYKIQGKGSKASKLYYLCAMLLQAFILYLTGSRTGMVAAVGGIGIMILFLMNKYVIAAFTSGCGALIVFFATKPQLFPRVTFLERNFQARFAIWEGAWRCFQAHPLFGQGSFTYYFNYLQSIDTPHEMYKTQHAHNLLLDPLASFGIIGSFLVLLYLAGFLKQAWLLFRAKTDKGLVALVAATLAVTLLHGVFDYTIFWVQTAMFFFFLLGAMAMYFPQTQIRMQMN